LAIGIVTSEAKYNQLILSNSIKRLWTEPIKSLEPAFGSIIAKPIVLSHAWVKNLKNKNFQM